MSITVICPDAVQRHDEPFTNETEARRWAEWGHACLSVDQHEFNWCPIDTDGVQAVTCHAEGWTWQPMPDVFETAQATERHINRWVRDQLRYSGPEAIELVYYGYDPRVLQDDDDPTSECIGTDGYPDAIGKVVDEDGTIEWECC